MGQTAEFAAGSWIVRQPPWSMKDCEYYIEKMRYLFYVTLREQKCQPA